jgi:putative membrane protein
MPATTSDRQVVTLVVVLLAAVVLLPTLLVGFGMMGGPMMGGTWGHMWADGGTVPGWAVAVNLLVQLLFLAAIVGAGYLTYRSVTSQTADRDRALDELRMAYARGDLSDEEYERRRTRLEEDT